jgi:SAM-dependent methyltransferase
MTTEPSDTRIDPKALETVQVPCPLCASGSDQAFANVNGYRIVRCARCAFLFVNPRPTEDSLGRLYSNQGNPYHSESFEPLAGESRVLSQVLRRICAYTTGGDLLEVGCGRGDLLRLARTAGFSVTGVDFFGGRKPAEAGMSFFDGDLRRARFPDASFDIVINRNLLEHTFDPGAEIREIGRVLKPRGQVYLKVPNVRFEHGWRCRLVFRARHLLEPPYHLNYFDPSSLKRLLADNGMDFLRWWIEAPSRDERYLANVQREVFYRLAQGCYLLSAGFVFPQVVLTCSAMKR